MYPTIAQYNTAIISGGAGTLRTGSGMQFIPSRTIPLPIYHFGSGTYAVVFKATNHQKTYALRCFISAETENIDRYRIITKYLSGIQATWLTPISLLENEFAVNGNYYPVLKMEWLDGLLLNKYIDQVLLQNERLTQLQEEFIRVSKSLEENRVGHGDIQCGNIIIQQNPDGSPRVRLIDYDGLYVPELYNRNNLERGRSEFQHPHRVHASFNEKIDRFSFWVILCALEALKYDKTLWRPVMQGGFNTLDNMLFTGQDLQNFGGSPLVNRLYALRQPSLDFYLDILNRSCLNTANMVSELGPYKGESYLSSTAPIPVQIPSSPTTALPTVNPKLADQLLITCEDGDAIVLDQSYRRLGTTPFAISRKNYFGTELLVARGTNVKRIRIVDQEEIIKVELADPVRPITVPADPMISNPVSPTPVPTPGPVSSPAATPKKDSDIIVYWVLGILVGIVVIAIIISLARNSSNTAYTSYTTDNTFVTADTVVTPEILNDVPTVDTTVDYAATADTTAALPPIDVSDNIPVYDNNGNSAEDVVRVFFDALNNNDCKKAWRNSFVDTWEANGEGWFCSNDVYGAVNYAKLNSIYETERSGNSITYRVNYTLQNIFYTRKCYLQDIRVTLESFTIKVWMITRMKNIIDPYYCES